MVALVLSVAGSAAGSAPIGPAGYHALAALPLITLDKVRRQLAQTLDIDAAGARDVAHGEFGRRQRHVLGEALIPGRARIRAGDELFHDRPARRLERRQRSRHVVAMLSQR